MPDPDSSDRPCPVWPPSADTPTAFVAMMPNPKIPRPPRSNLRFDHYNDVVLLGPPTMRGAIVFGGSSHPKLVDGVCDRLGMKPGSATLGKFKNGETSVTIRMAYWSAASLAF
jgi:hypothetical protein